MRILNDLFARFDKLASVSFAIVVDLGIRRRTFILPTLQNRQFLENDKVSFRFLLKIELLPLSLCVFRFHTNDKVLTYHSFLLSKFTELCDEVFYREFFNIPFCQRFPLFHVMH